jgi:dihydroorotate dehydrogenase electron transfer subunit
MIQYTASILSIENLISDIWMITFHLPENYPIVLAGQFVNIRVQDSPTPFFRRPFSFYGQSPGRGQILFHVVGEGTKILAQKKVGDPLFLLGPLGNSFSIDGEFDTALLVAGGLGVAPMSLLSDQLRKAGKNIITLLGARTKEQIISRNLENITITTDDGSMGLRGTVVDVLRKHLKERRYSNPKIFACGPIPMINKIYSVINEFNIPCEVSLEGTMACGIGICQGCPVEVRDNEKKFKLICKEGPVFDLHSLRVPING